MVNYVVEASPPSAVRGELEALWQRNLPIEVSAAQKFSWLYEHAPDVPPAAYVLRADSDVVGCAGVGVRRIAIAGEIYRGGLLQDLAVDAPHRSVGPALTLVRAVKAAALSDFALAYGYPNAHAEGVFRRAGYSVLGQTTRYVRVLRHEAYLARPEVSARIWEPLQPLATSSAVRKVVGAVVDAGQLMRHGLPSGHADWQAEPDARIDTIWQRAHAQYGAVAERSAGFLRWRWSLAPTHFVTWSDAHAPAAYAVLRQAGDAMHIVDVFGAPDAVSHLVDHLAWGALRRGAKSLSIRLLGSPWLVRQLAAQGFVAREGRRTVTVGVGDKLPVAIRASVLDPNYWHLTDSDEDI